MALKKAAADREPEFDEAAQEIIGALTKFRDTLRARTPLETRYTVRKVVVVVPPPQLRPEDVRKTRAVLGVSQPVFADFLGTSPSTVRSWEQGQKPPSPMARRLLGLIASDPTYWRSRFSSMVEARGSEHQASSDARSPGGRAGALPETVVPRRRSRAATKNGSKKKARSFASHGRRSNGKTES